VDLGEVTKRVYIQFDAACRCCSCGCGRYASDRSRTTTRGATAKRGGAARPPATDALRRVVRLAPVTGSPRGAVALSSCRPRLEREHEPYFRWRLATYGPFN